MSLITPLLSLKWLTMMRLSLWGLPLKISSKPLLTYKLARISTKRFKSGAAWWRDSDGKYVLIATNSCSTSMLIMRAQKDLLLSETMAPWKNNAKQQEIHPSSIKPVYIILTEMSPGRMHGSISGSRQQRLREINSHVRARMPLLIQTKPCDYRF